MRTARRRRLAALLAAAVLLGGCTGDSGGAGPVRPGSTLEVLGPWAGTEQAQFGRVLAAFTAATGVRVHYVSYNGKYLPALLEQRLAARYPPDVALLPQPGMLRHYAAAGQLVPLDAATRRTVAAHYPAGWQALATYRDREYGVWFKAANKSLVWYDVATFERAGVVPPTDLAGLDRVAALLRQRGSTPFAVGAADGWVLTDWFENIYLRTAGPARYDALAAHRIGWTDPSVTRALTLLRRLLAAPNLLGGTAGALRTRFPASVAQAFGPPARTAMLVEGDFVAGFLADGGLGTRVDVFPFPGTWGGLPLVVAGGDVAVQMTPSRAGAALLRYLASPEAAAVWAAAGGFISPNLDVDLDLYPDAVSRAVARGLIEAGGGFRFDLSDLLPAEFGSTPNGGVQAALRRLLGDGDVAAAQRRLEADAVVAGG